MKDYLTFSATARAVEYGDKRTFYEYKVLFHHGLETVGSEDGPRRTSTDRSSAIKAARVRIKELRGHRLFVIRVTRKHIEDGRARECNTCAIAQALWHNQERMGFSRYDFTFDVSPYGGWTDPRGLVLRKQFSDWDEGEHIPVDEMPDLHQCTIAGRSYSENMPEWAMQWDEWAESRSMSLKEWREQHGYQPNHYPCRPAPCSFVLDLDAFRPQVAA